MKMVVGLIEKVKLIGRKKSLTTLAKFDTGAKWSSIDKRLAKKLGVKVIKEKKVKSSLGKQKRMLVELKMEIYGRRFDVKATMADRSKLNYLFLVGRNLIFRNFIVDVEKTNNSPSSIDLKDYLKDDFKKLKKIREVLGVKR